MTSRRLPWPLVFQVLGVALVGALSAVPLLAAGWEIVRALRAEELRVGSESRRVTQELDAPDATRGALRLSATMPECLATTWC